MSSVEQKIREVQQRLADDVEVQRYGVENGLKKPATAFNAVQDLVDQATQAILQIIQDDVIGEDEEMHQLNPSMNAGILQMVRESNYLADNQNKLRAKQRANLREDNGNEKH